MEITPAAGVHLTGDVSRHRPATLVADPLFARAVVLRSGDRMVCILTLDVTIVTEPYTVQIRQVAAERYGLDPDAVMVHATQTHSAPSLGAFMVDSDFPPFPAGCEWVGGGDAAYSAWATERAVEAIGAAVQSLRPVQLGVASGIEGRFAFNRRAVTGDGTVVMPGRTWPGGLGPTYIRYIEGPMDPELGVVCLRDRSLQVRAVLVHHTCHPVHVFPSCVVSSDWPGAVCSELEEMYGEACVPAVLNGCCGNINPWPPFDPDYVEDHRRMGRVLAQGARRVMETMSFTDQAVLDWRVRRVPIPLRELTEEELRWAAELLARHPEPLWTDDSRTQVDLDWMVAASVTSVHLMRQRGPDLQYEIQVLRIGDAAIVGLPGEPFVEGQLAVKLRSPAYPTYVAHCTSQYVGYIPTREALQRGGHEVNTRYWAKLAPEALDLIVDNTVSVLGELWGR